MEKTNEKMETHWKFAREGIPLKNINKDYSKISVIPGGDEELDESDIDEE